MRSLFLCILFFCAGSYEVLAQTYGGMTFEELAMLGEISERLIPYAKVVDTDMQGGDSVESLIAEAEKRRDEVQKAAFSELSVAEQGVYGTEVAFLSSVDGPLLGEGKDATLGKAHRKAVGRLLTAAERTLLGLGAEPRDDRYEIGGVTRASTKEQIEKAIAENRYGRIVSGATHTAQVNLILGEEYRGTHVQKASFATKLGLQDNREMTVADIPAAIKTAWEAAVMDCVTPWQKAIFKEALEADPTAATLMPLLGGDADLPVTTTRADLRDAADGTPGIIGNAAIKAIEEDRKLEMGDARPPTLFGDAVEFFKSTPVDADLAPYTLGQKKQGDTMAQKSRGLYDLLAKWVAEIPADVSFTGFLTSYRGLTKEGVDGSDAAVRLNQGGGAAWEGLTLDQKYACVAVFFWDKVRNVVCNRALFDGIGDGTLDGFFAWVKEDARFIAEAPDATGSWSLAGRGGLFSIFKVKLLGH